MDESEIVAVGSIGQDRGSRGVVNIDSTVARTLGIRIDSLGRKVKVRKRD